MYTAGDVVKIKKSINDIAKNGMREVISENSDGTITIGLIGASKLKNNKINIIKAKYVEKVSEPYQDSSGGLYSTFIPFV